MATEGKLELTIKINEFPSDVTTAENGWKSFDLDCDGRIFSVSFRPTSYKNKRFRLLESTSHFINKLHQ
jgi:hypothetical protein